MKSSNKFNALLSLLLVFALLLGPVQGVFAQEDTDAKPEVVTKTADDNKVEIKVLYMNDVHGRISFNNKRTSQIGYGKMKTYYDSIKGNKLLLDVGDSSQGTVEVNLKKGAPSFTLMGLMGVDASVLGNHEFDFSYEVLKNNIKLAGGKYPILGSNIIAENGERPFDNHIIRDFNGVKVGIFGIDTPETKYKANPLNTKGLEFEAPVVTAKRKVAELKKLGADIIICMTHLGIDGSTKPEERGTYVLEHVDGIDLLLDGHSHTIGSKKIGNGYYAQAAKYSELLGEATLTFDKTTKKVSVENQFHYTYTAEMLAKNKNNAYYADFYTHIGKDLTNVKPDQTIENYIAQLQKEVEPIKKEVVGESKVHLEGVGGNVRTRQTNLSTIIADAMRKAGKADVALTNGGGIRDSIQAGKITKGDVLTVLPFGNTVTVIKVTGQKIYEALKHGTDSYPSPKGAYPQVSNMTFDILTNKEGKPIDVVNIKIGGKDIDLKAEYTLATNDFMAVGGDGYKMFTGAYQVGVHEGMAEIVMDYIKELSPITMKDEDIKITKILKEDEYNKSKENKTNTGKTTNKKTGKDTQNKTPQINAKPKVKGKSPSTSDISLLAPIALLALSSGGYLVLRKKKEEKLD